MTDLFEDVRRFHEKFGIDVHGSVVPNLLSPADQLYRLAFLYEELHEFQVAWNEGDLADAADALVDLTVIVLGTAHMMGLDFVEHWKVVQSANMTKERAQGAKDARSKRKNRLDIVKPEGWVAPDHEPILVRTTLGVARIEAQRHRSVVENDG